MTATRLQVMVAQATAQLSSAIHAHGMTNKASQDATLSVVTRRSLAKRVVMMATSSPVMDVLATVMLRSDSLALSMRN